VAVRGTFRHRQDQALSPAGEMEPFCFEDVYEGDPHTTLLIRQTDLTPGKRGTDVTFLGSAFAPGGEPRAAFDCSLRVGTVEKTLRVTGPRDWRAETRRTWRGLLEREPKPVLTGWTLTEPEPVAAVPLGWDKAFGGPVPAPDGEEGDVDPRNPLGPGFPDPRAGDAGSLRPAHRIEDPERLVTDWRDREAQPEGFGLVSPWWLWRQRHAGTYDEAWLADRHPLLPLDFDERFWQSAHPDLVAVPFLRGTESYRLLNLHPSIAEVAGRLPGIGLAVYCENGDEASGGWHRLALDGVHFDFRDDREEVAITWRCRFPLNEPERAELTLGRVALAPATTEPRTSA